MKSETSRLKQKAWRMFALYILLRDASPTGHCQCCTCRAIKPFWDKDMQAGHFISGRSNAVLFDDHIVHSQCASCNGGYGTYSGSRGEQARYAFFMKRKYGYSDKEIEIMLEVKRPVLQLKKHNFIDIIKNYHEMICNMKTSFNENAQNMIDERIKTMGVKKILES